MRRLSRIVFICSMMFTSQLASADPQSELGGLLSEVKSFGAEFVQTTQDRQGEVVSVSEGSLLVSTGGKFRIETAQPFSQQLISNGEDFYNYDLELEQVVVRPLVKDVGQVPILMLGNADPDEFLDEYLVEKKTRSFVLNPKSSGVFEYLALTFQGNTPEAITFKDSLGQTTEIQFSNGSLNPSFLPDVFEFVLPDGIDLVDDR